jgi:hypothetical protein
MRNAAEEIDRKTDDGPRYLRRLVRWLRRSHDWHIGRIGFHYEPHYARSTNYLFAGIERIGGGSKHCSWWQVRFARVVVSLRILPPNVEGRGGAND